MKNETWDVVTPGEVFEMARERGRMHALTVYVGDLREYAAKPDAAWVKDAITAAFDTGIEGPEDLRAAFIEGYTSGSIEMINERLRRYERISSGDSPFHVKRKRGGNVPR